MMAACLEYSLQEYGLSNKSYHMFLFDFLLIQTGPIVLWEHVKHLPFLEMFDNLEGKHRQEYWTFLPTKPGRTQSFWYTKVDPKGREGSSQL